MSVWTRAVIAPAVKRAGAVWCGAGIVGAVIFGPTAMHPSDLTGLALHDPTVGAVLAVTWLLLFVPTARIIVRADAALYLRALPHREWPVWLVAAAALVGLQLPWLALWVIGEGVRGLLVVVAVTAVVVAIALWRPRRRHARMPAWSGPLVALAGVYTRGLLRKAGDALVRGLGLAVLAGITGALMVRNNHVEGADAAVVAGAVIAIVLVPAVVGALLPLATAHRSSAALAQSLGISERARVAVLAAVVVAVHAVAALVASTIALAMTHELLVVPVAVALAAGMALTTSRVLATARDAVRIVVGAIVAAAMSVMWLGWLGAVGALLALATGAVVALSTRTA